MACVCMANFTPVMHRYNEVKVSLIDDNNKRDPYLKLAAGE